MSRPVKKARQAIHVTCAEAMEWLDRLSYMESALESVEQTPEKRRILEDRIRWLRHGLAILTEEERNILLWTTEGCTVDELCARTAREKSSFYNVRKRAMNRFALALFGRLR